MGEVCPVPLVSKALISMKKLIFTCFLAYLCLYGSTSTAQVAEPPGADFLHRSRPTVPHELRDIHRGGETRSDTLSIGDQIPSGIEFSDVLHYDLDKLRLKDYLGKYVILEFWAPTCTASIGSLPKMNDLAKKFGDQVAILPVTVFDKEQIEEVFSAYSSLSDVELPLVVNAHQMRSYFPHSRIPHFVVLDPMGKVVAITGVEDITAENLNRLLTGDASGFRVKEDKQIKLGRYDKLISESPQVKNKNIWFQSAFTGYIPDVGGSLIQDFNDLSHIRIVNMPLFKFYQLAYSENDLVDYFGRNRIETVGFGAEELYTDKKGADYREWKEEGNHVFGYELVAPPTLNPYQLLREDLIRYFPNITAEVVPKRRMVYALILQEETMAAASQQERSYQADAMGLRMTNYPLQGFIYHLNSYFQQHSNYPIVNLTGIEFPIDLDLEAQLSSIASLQQEFREKGFELILREEVIPVLMLHKNADLNLLGQ